MKRIAGLLAATVGVAATLTGVAAAASSPTVATRPAVAVTDTTAVLQSVVNPNGNQTSYAFKYGVTSAFGQTTISRSAGHGTEPVLGELTIRGLTPGTIYYFQVEALNKSGAAFGITRTFKTTGNPPAQAVTGQAVNVGKYQATPTGSIDPEGAATNWLIQYGLTTSYGVQTFGQTLAPLNTSLPVSVQLSGLAPGKLFHYRLVALHGDIVSYGADATFFTFPSFRRTPAISVHTSPSRDTRKPYGFTTKGTLHGAGFVPEPLRCTGQVRIRFFHGTRRVADAVAQVQPDCTFSTPVQFNHLIRGGPAALSVAIHFRGNGYLKPADRTNHVTLG